MKNRDALRTRAERGEYVDMLDLALDCHLGMHGPIDAKEARYWYERILASGHTSRAVETGLGELLVNGEGGPRDLVRGLTLIEPHAGDNPYVALTAARAARALAAEFYADALKHPESSDPAEVTEAREFLGTYPQRERGH